MQLIRVMVKVCNFIALMAVFTTCAQAREPALGPVTAVLERVVDGDTVRFRVAIWIDQELSVAVRIAGIDAPELFRPKCDAERALAREAKTFVEGFLGNGAVTLHDIENGKYAGRVVARVETARGDLGDALAAAGLAVKGPRGNWC